MADSTFHFSVQVPRLLLDNWTIETTRDFVVVLLALCVAVVLLEGVKRVSRECWRKVPIPSKGKHANNRLRRQRSDRIPLTRYTSLNTDEEKPAYQERATCLTTDNDPPCLTTTRKGNLPKNQVNGSHLGNEKVCCSDESDRIIDETGARDEATSFVDTPGNGQSCCQETHQMSEERKRAQTERMWKSLSMDFLADRWEMLQTNSEEQNVGRITTSYRLFFHCVQTVITMAESTLAYVIMLVVMTYNAWFLIVVAGGACLGYLLFSSDLERLYASYANWYIKKKIMEEDAKRKACPCAPPPEEQLGE